MIKKVFLPLILLLMLIYNITVFYVDENIKNNENKNVYDSCHKIWAARGIYTNHHEQNSLKSINNAFSLGANGIEVDFFYDSKMDDFIISHGRPKKSNDGNLIYTKKDGEILTLEKVLKTFSKKYFWLDYKNLDRISKEDTTKAITRLLEITKYNSIRERLYIEGSNPLRLSKYTNSGFKTLLAVRPLPQNSIFSSISSNIYKLLYYFNNITALAISHGDIKNPYYSTQAQISLKNIPVFLFHVPGDEKLLKSLVEKDDVRVILAGRDKSLNRFYINRCK